MIRRRDPGWAPDPERRFPYRWWDGRRWGPMVSIDGFRADPDPNHFEELGARERVWHTSDWAATVDVAAYRDPGRVARFGPVTMPVGANLRCWPATGEARHQDTLAQIAGPPAAIGRWHEQAAVLIPEDGNPYDDWAVRVEIAGRHVGYLPGSDAPRHRRLINRTIAAHGWATCPAVINGGWIDTGTGGTGHYGVRLYWHYDLPATQLPPAGPDESRVPYDPNVEFDRISVTGEEHHQDTLGSLIGGVWPGDHPLVVAQLDLGEDTKGRPTVVVSIAGHPVGSLTQKMTARFQPAVEAARHQGRRLTTAATLQPSTRKGREDQIDVGLVVPRGWGHTRR